MHYSFKQFLLEKAQTSISLELYHGTNEKFNEFSQEKARMQNDYFGGGIAYLTTDLSVAQTYAKSMVKTKKSGTPTILNVKATFKNVFDVNKIFTGEELQKFVNKSNAEDFARGAKLLKINVDKYEIISKLKSGKLSLTGKDVFYGLSKGMVDTAKARGILIDLGYDALKYNGGENMSMATKHDVYIAYDNKTLKITN